MAEPETEAVEEDDPYETFSKALDTAREAVDKISGREKKEPETLKAAGKLARAVFAEHRKAKPPPKRQEQPTAP